MTGPFVRRIWPLALATATSLFFSLPTREMELPWVNTSLIGDYRLNPQPAEKTAKAPAAAPEPAVFGRDSRTHEDLLWESAQHSNLSADYQAYLDAFPNGVFAQMAKNRIASLQQPALASLQGGAAQRTARHLRRRLSSRRRCDVRRQRTASTRSASARRTRTGRTGTPSTSPGSRRASRCRREQRLRRPPSARRKDRRRLLIRDAGLR